MNIYVYSPKDDPYLRERWRETYPADKLAELKTPVQRATADHVEFTYALSPGLSVCYGSDADEQALVAKFQSLWDIGVRSFSVPLDDITYTNWNCAEDKAKFGTGGAAAGAAQAYLLNAVQRDFIATHPGADRLQMVPTEYYDVRRVRVQDRDRTRTRSGGGGRVDRCRRRSRKTDHRSRRRRRRRGLRPRHPVVGQLPGQRLRHRPAAARPLRRPGPGRCPPAWTAPPPTR